MKENTSKEDSLNTIKVVGRHHSFLIDIVDEINSCYSSQVTRIQKHTLQALKFTH